MGASIIFVGSCLLLLSFFSHNVIARNIKSHTHPTLDAVNNTFNVINFGATGDGNVDDSKAFLEAWKSACLCQGTPVLLVPAEKTFLLKPIAFLGPCKSSQIQFSLQGIIVAPSTFDGWTNCKDNSWIYFGDVQGLQFKGSGKIDGQGALWWRKPVPPGAGCVKRPTALRFHNCNGLLLQGTTHVDSPMNHIEVKGCQNVEMSQLNIIAPFDSPNTDGIDIGSSSHIYIHESFIGTGDDCIAIKGESYFVNITGLHCGPGHGISVGSLGEGGATNIVENVFVHNCTLNGTTNGARIKTWEGGSGHVSGVTFEGITLVNSKYPIIIDQSYTDGGEMVGSAVEVTDVTFRGFQGTSATGEAISLQCSGKLPCTNLKLDNINIRSTAAGGNVVSKCEFAHGIIVPPVVPNVACLLK